uniref:Uncharacterized protein n=1 Tax=viral metagenome TaxID=1070528 RepID=A0A6C0FHM4_9ZZZZ|tara:strand:+ start:5599 stop:6180 length:582 start_codon:yes stop_codon:yes gene_type:complete
MIKDLTKIRELLIDYVEVEMPYDFNKGCDIQYVTCSLDEEGNIDISNESFYPNCKFIRRCNDNLIVECNGLTKYVPIYRRDKVGNIIYKSRFFILEENEDGIVDNQMGGGKKEDIRELKDTIEYQQSIIEKLTERIKYVEIEKHEVQGQISTYEELLQEGRYKLKELSLELREKTDKLNHYEEIIPKLINSRR